MLSAQYLYQVSASPFYPQHPKYFLTHVDRGHRGETIEFYSEGDSMVHLTGYTVEPDMSDEDGEAEQEEIPSDEENKAIMADMRRRMKSGTFDDDDADDSDDSDGSEDDGQVEQVKTHLGDGDEGADSSEEEQMPAQPQKRKREDTAQQARTEAEKLSPDTPEGQAALAEWHERCFNFC
eukprot:COSAG01_NODE_16897_length_1195_cov_1.576642_1_plen_178_part_10